MKKIITLLLTLFIVKIAGIASEYQPLVVKDRIWWYESTEVTPDYKDIPFVVGVRIGEATEEEPDWYPCLVVDSNYVKVLDHPVAWLKEENKKVWMRPNLNLDKEEDVQTREAKLMRYMLGYWYGNEIPWIKDMYPNNNASWNPMNLTEFLLYDFNYEVGATYDWPWTGRLITGRERCEFSTGIFKIKSITDKTILNESGHPRSVKSYSLVEEVTEGEEIPFPGQLYLLEGIGVTEGSPYPILLSVRSWEGFFFAPDAFSYVPDFSCIWTGEIIPELTSVVDPDGQVIYSNKPFQAGIEDSFSPSEINSFETPKTIYDLHGRQIVNPQPGSIYIRDGKKFVAK